MAAAGAASSQGAPILPAPPSGGGGDTGTGGGGTDPGGGGGTGPGPSPTVTVTPATITSHKPHGGTSTFTFSSVVAGGTGPYRYAWDEGDGARDGPTVTFSKHAPADDEADGIVNLTVTDSTGAVGHGSGQWFALGF
jgi:hypothetical protein